jgi:predicted nucleotidyltransferase
MFQRCAHLSDIENRVVRAAQAYFEANSVFVIGSTARGDCTTLSDMDVLVISRTRAEVASFHQQIAHFESRPVSIILYSPEDFQSLWGEGSLFIYHVLKEGCLHSDDGTFAAMVCRGEFTLKNCFREDIEEQLTRLQLYEDTSRFNDIYLHVLARLFSIYKNIVFFSLAERGTPEFNKHRAFDRFYWIYPHARKMRPKMDYLHRFYLEAAKGVSFVELEHRSVTANSVRWYLKSIRRLRVDIR